MSPLWLRGIAILIALAAALDPAITSTRRTRPDVSLVMGDAADAGLGDRIARSLGSVATVIRAPFPAANATVIAGERIPHAAELASPVFAVLRDTGELRLSLERVDAPSVVSLDARVPVRATAHIANARDRTVELTLRSGQLIVDRITHVVTADAEPWSASLTFVPGQTGMVPLRVSFGIANAEPQASTDLALEVVDRRWAILFYDARPSWMSTFVRRTLERDPRFVVTSRVLTSRNAGIDAGRPPTTLDQLAPVALYDAILVGAPESLTDREVAGLEHYLRRRGGALVLLLDQTASGPYRSLLGAAEWASESRDTAIALEKNAQDPAPLRAGQLLWPRRLPYGGRALAVTADSLRRPVVWQSPVGAGSLVVSGALDAWQYRDPDISGFDAFWRTLVAELAGTSLPPIDIALSRSIAATADTIEVVATLRDAALSSLAPGQDISARVSAQLESSEGNVPIRLWPDGPVGQLRGTVRAPDSPGTFRITVASEGERASASFIARPAVSITASTDRDLLSALANGSGGAAMTASQLDELPARLDRTLQPVPRRITWHPMRSAWWILPFALALGAEWLLRRRRGLA
jgi:hypothetical protein